jgi:hypothetical protein
MKIVDPIGTGWFARRPTTRTTPAINTAQIASASTT